MVPVFLWEEERHREESYDPLLMKIVVPSGMPIKPNWVRLVGITQLSQAGWLKHSATEGSSNSACSKEREICKRSS